MSSVPVQDTPDPSPTEPIEERFQRLAAVWHRDTDYLSSMAESDRHPAYQQLHAPFEPCMAFIDLLLNYGPESGEILLHAPLGRLETIFT